MRVNLQITRGLAFTVVTQGCTEIICFLLLNPFITQCTNSQFVVWPIALLWGALSKAFWKLADTSYFLNSLGLLRRFEGTELQLVWSCMRKLSSSMVASSALRSALPVFISDSYFGTGKFFSLGKHPCFSVVLQALSSHSVLKFSFWTLWILLTSSDWVFSTCFGTSSSEMFIFIVSHS